SSTIANFILPLYITFYIYGCAFSLRCRYIQCAVNKIHPILDIFDTEAIRCLVFFKTSSIVFYGEIKPVFVLTDLNNNHSGMCMFECITDTFLGNTVQSQFCCEWNMATYVICFKLYF